MINEKWKGEEYYWVTENMKQVIIHTEKDIELGSLVDVKITKWVVFKLDGDLI